MSSEERAKLVKLEYDEVRAKYEHEYGELSDQDVSKILAAEREMEPCLKCKGLPCLKGYSPNIRVRLLNEEGRVVVERKPCRYYGERLIRVNCEKSGVPYRYARREFEEYEVTAQNKKAYELAEEFAQTKPRDSLYLYGNTGTGKTFLASLIAREYLLSDRSVVFGDVPSLLDNLKQCFENGQSVQEMMRKYERCSLLVLDDVGSGYLTAWNVGILYQLINARYNEDLPMVVTSNYDLQGLGNYFNTVDRMTSRRIVSRLQEMAVFASTGAADRRLREGLRK